MKKTPPKRSNGLRPEYDFATMKGGVHGKYAQRVRQSSNIVLLEPDVAKAFPTEDAVNNALRSLLRKSPSSRR
jgi:hypothetical protein